MIIHPGVKLRHIRAFLDIATEGTLSAVARRQGISQPALSRTLAELEDLLAAPLFLREKRRLVLTPEGALFRHHASIGLQSLENGAAALHPSSFGGSIRVGILPTAASRLIPRVAVRFRDLRPETTIKIETGPHGFLLSLLREAKIDLMIGRMPDPREMAGLLFSHLYEEDVVLVARADHPLKARPVADLLAEVPVILPTEEAVIRKTVDNYLEVLGLPRIRPAVETVALAVGRGMLAASDSVWFISRGVVAEELRRGEMIEIPTGVRFLSGAVGITQRQAAPVHSGVALLQRLCVEEAALTGPHDGL